MMCTLPPFALSSYPFVQVGVIMSVAPEVMAPELKGKSLAQKRWNFALGSGQLALAMISHLSRNAENEEIQSIVGSSLLVFHVGVVAQKIRAITSGEKPDMAPLAIHGVLAGAFLYARMLA